MTTQAIQRTFRRILSGDDQGQPPWVRAIGLPGDVGWFGPDSVVWEVHGSLATLVGGVRALLLQTCHPLALAGVEQHSTYRTDPLGRLQRTNQFVTTTTFGSSNQAEAVAAAVRKVHQSVVGTAPDGRPYAATDPRLLLWVHLTLTDSMLVAAQHYHRRPVDADAYVADMAVTGGAVGVVDPPRSEVELKAALESFVGEVAGGQEAREVARFLRWPYPALPAAAMPPYLMLARAATDLLPPWAHPLLGTSPNPSLVRMVDQATCTVMLRGLQAVLGPRSVAATLAYQRLGVPA